MPRTSRFRKTIEMKLAAHEAGQRGSSAASLQALRNRARLNGIRLEPLSKKQRQQLADWTSAYIYTFGRGEKLDAVIDKLLFIKKLAGFSYKDLVIGGAQLTRVQAREKIIDVLEARKKELAAEPREPSKRAQRKQSRKFKM